MITYLKSLDYVVFLFVNKTISCPLFDSFFLFITNGRHWVFPLIVCSILYIVKKKKKACIVLLFAGITIAITDPLCYKVLKPLFHRLRPCHPSYFENGAHNFLAGAHFLLGMKSSFSFPSNHAINFCAQSMLLSFFYPQKSIYFFIPSILVCISRVYVGVHYPSDVLVGGCLGLGIAYGVFFLYNYTTALMVKTALLKIKP